MKTNTFYLKKDYKENLIEKIDYNSIRNDGRFNFEERESIISIEYKEKFLELKFESGLTKFSILTLYSSKEYNLSVEYFNKKLLNTKLNNKEILLINERKDYYNYINYIPIEVDNIISLKKRANYLSSKLITIFNFILLEPVDIKINIENEDGNLLSNLINYLMMSLCLSGYNCLDYIVASQLSFINNSILKDLTKIEEKSYASILGIWEINSKRNLSILSENKILKSVFKKLYKETEIDCIKKYKEFKKILYEISNKII